MPSLTNVYLTKYSFRYKQFVLTDYSYRFISFSQIDIGHLIPFFM